MSFSLVHSIWIFNIDEKKNKRRMKERERERVTSMCCIDVEKVWLVLFVGLFVENIKLKYNSCSYRTKLN